MYNLYICAYIQEYKQTLKKGNKQHFIYKHMYIIIYLQKKTKMIFK